MAKEQYSGGQQPGQDQSQPDDTSMVVVELGALLGDVDQYASRRGLSRALAVVELVRTALTTPVTNQISGTVGPGTVIQAGDVTGGIKF